MPTGEPSQPVPAPPVRSAPRGSASRDRTAASRGSAPSLGRSARRHERSRERASRHRERALVRRRLATPPPDYPPGPFDDLDDGDRFSADGADGPAGDGSGRRKTRLRLALAALPLAVAVALFVVTGPGSGPAPDQDTTVAEDTAAVTGVLSGPDPTEPLPGHGVDAGSTDAESVHADDADAHGADMGVADVGVSDADGGASPVPTAPSGHRPVALRIADPAALSLVATGDRVDVVGMDGSVLAERLEVLQDRSSGSDPVLVLAVPDGSGPALAAAALSREVTVILSGEAAVP